MNRRRQQEGECFEISGGIAGERLAADLRA